jgi:hypothetical protein
MTAGPAERTAAARPAARRAQAAKGTAKSRAPARQDQPAKSGGALSPAPRPARPAARARTDRGPARPAQAAQAGKPAAQPAQPAQARKPAAKPAQPAQAPKPAAKPARPAPAPKAPPRPAQRAVTAAISKEGGRIVLPYGIGPVRVLSPDRLAFYGGIAALALFGIMEWPVALVIGVGHLLADDHHHKLLADFGEALGEA